MTAFVGLVIAAAIIGAMWQAARSDSIVVDSFHAPPAVAAQGLDGTVVASGVLDDLVIAAAIIGAMWQAARSDSIVVDSFHAPPAVAAQGLDGTVVASGVLDEL